MSDISDSDEPEAGDDKPWLWSRLARAVLPDRIVHRWDRLLESNQKDAAHYNMRSGL